MSPEFIFPIFFVVWTLLAAGGFWLFYLNRNAAFKRKYFPWYGGLGGVLFLGFIAIGFPIVGVAIATPFVALIIYVNLKFTQFCDACGRTIIQQVPFSRPAFCSGCGAPLGDRQSDRDRE